MARSLDEAGEPRRIASGDAPEAKPLPGPQRKGPAASPYFQGDLRECFLIL